MSEFDWLLDDNIDETVLHPHFRKLRRAFREYLETGRLPDGRRIYGKVVISQ